MLLRYELAPCLQTQIILHAAIFSYLELDDISIMSLLRHFVDLPTMLISTGKRERLPAEVVPQQQALNPAL